MTGGRPRGSRALVYRGPASLPGCSEAVAALLQSSRWGFDVRYVGPREDLPLCAETLASAVVYAQPGGGTLRKGYRRMKRHRGLLREWVGSGGRYLGFCLGGYLAGATPGFGLLPGDTDRHIGTPGAAVSGEEDTLTQVCWRGRWRFMYFQDGAAFVLRRGAEGDDGVEVLAHYPNGQVAALAAPFGAGRVAVVGPHPEASSEWYAERGLVDPDGPDADLGHDLVDEVMR